MAEAFEVVWDSQTRHKCGPIWKAFPLTRLSTDYVPAGIFHTRKFIGKGASAIVQLMKARQDKPSRLYAVKSFHKVHEKEPTIKYYDRVFWEFTLGADFEHQNIIQTIALCEKSTRLHQVMEHCPTGDLYNLVKTRSPPFSDKISWFKQLLRGVSYLHDRGIAHRDLKLENVLMGQDGLVKIIDFGLAAVVRGTHPGLLKARKDKRSPSSILLSRPSRAGSQSYKSPEVVAMNCAYDPTKLDIWSCGVILVILMQGRHPWRQADSTKDAHYERFEVGWTEYLKEEENTNPGTIAGDTYPRCGEIFGTLSSRAQERCVLRMLHPAPELRVSIKEALKDSWVRSIPDHKPCDSAV